mmetsp:Transcript_63250/g.184832  ORF Transcript_63250/g.184832 Transcript_63250/m.184832 type:complete len:280 (+) Transcript_63250:967-1806(+)
MLTHVAECECRRAAHLALSMAQHAREGAPGPWVILQLGRHLPTLLRRGKADLVVIVGQAVNDLVAVLLACIAHKAQGIDGLQPRPRLRDLLRHLRRAARARLAQLAQRHAGGALDLRGLVPQHVRELLHAVLGLEGAHGRAGPAPDDLALVVEQRLHGPQGTRCVRAHGSKAHAGRVLHLEVTVGQQHADVLHVVQGVLAGVLRGVAHGLLHFRRVARAQHVHDLVQVLHELVLGAARQILHDSCLLRICIAPVQVERGLICTDLAVDCQSLVRNGHGC